MITSPCCSIPTDYRSQSSKWCRHCLVMLVLGGLENETMSRQQALTSHGFPKALRPDRLSESAPAVVASSSTCRMNAVLKAAQEDMEPLLPGHATAAKCRMPPAFTFGLRAASLPASVHT